MHTDPTTQKVVPEPTILILKMVFLQCCLFVSFLGMGRCPASSVKATQPSKPGQVSHSGAYQNLSQSTTFPSCDSTEVSTANLLDAATPGRLLPENWKQTMSANYLECFTCEQSVVAILKLPQISVMQKPTLSFQGVYAC